jgi:hypothetical protein
MRGAHRSLELAGLEGGCNCSAVWRERGGDLSAVFSCTDNIARVVLADCVGHGYVASGVARHVHHLLHKHQDIRNTATLLAALNDEFTLDSEKSKGALRLTTVVTGTFDGTTGVQFCVRRSSANAPLAVARKASFLRLAMGWKTCPSVL